jgi:hypothetical protein
MKYSTITDYKLSKFILKQLPTLYSGHFANLKIETPKIRIWLERETEQILVEKLIMGVWTKIN